MTSIQLTIYFEEPFWVGVFERIEDERLTASKLTFGAEPRDYEVHAWLLEQFSSLRFSPAVQADRHRRADNPRRRQRCARQQMQNTGVGTRSQQALAAQREEMKTRRSQLSRAQREADQQRKFALKQQKRREKHRGR